ncbi:MAG: MFS transporter [Kiritimatiellae bacterium]|nr:MFS transporter [Kiritimatiellia bacterium]
MSIQQKVSVKTRVILSALYFLQYMALPVWFITLVPYAKSMGAQGSTLALIVSAMAIGSLSAPFVGMVTDRFFAAQKVMAVLNVLSAIGLVLAGMQTSVLALILCLTLTMIVYMPTWSTINYIIFSHCPKDIFLQIRVFAVIGWISAAAFSVVGDWFGVKVNGTPLMFFCGAATVLAAAVLALFVPNTLPKARGQPIKVIDVLGLRAVSMLKDPGFALFMALIFLSEIPFSLYFGYGGEFLTDMGFKNPTLSMSFGQYSEILFTLLLASAIKKIGAKNAITIGFGALTLRYLFFWLGGSAGVYGGILLHGVVFGFLYVGAQIYVDSRAEESIRAQAQGFFNLVAFGMGTVVANFVNRTFIDRLRVTATDASGVVESNWSGVWLVTMIISAVLLLTFALFCRKADKEISA